MTDYISREAAIELLTMALEDDWEAGYAADRMMELPAVSIPQWQSADTPPDSERNIFICYGNPAFRSVCVGHYDHEMERFYEDRNFFAKPIYDAMYWCDMPRLPDMEG